MIKINFKRTWQCICYFFLWDHCLSKVQISHDSVFLHCTLLPLLIMAKCCRLRWRSLTNDYVIMFYDSSYLCCLHSLETFGHITYLSRQCNAAKLTRHLLDNKPCDYRRAVSWCQDLINPSIQTQNHRVQLLIKTIRQAYFQKVHSSSSSLFMFFICVTFHLFIIVFRYS